MTSDMVCEIETAGVYMIRGVSGCYGRHGVRLCTPDGPEGTVWVLHKRNTPLGRLLATYKNEPWYEVMLSEDHREPAERPPAERHDTLAAAFASLRAKAGGRRIVRTDPLAGWPDWSRD